jgi:hypothetical protein
MSGTILESDVQCDAFEGWRKSLTGTETSITMSANGVTVECTDPTEAAAITTYIRDWTDPGTTGFEQALTCDGKNWAFGKCQFNATACPRGGLEIRAGGDNNICGECSSQNPLFPLFIRPCVNNNTMGTINGCGGVPQTFVITTTFDPPV